MVGTYVWCGYVLKYPDCQIHGNVIFTHCYDLLWEYQCYKLIKTLQSVFQIDGY